MIVFDRYALYYMLPPGPLAEALAGWLGWDSATGRSCAAPDLPGLPRPASELTARPRKYGAHATMKPPFHLASDCSRAALEDALAVFATRTAAVCLDGLEVSRIGRFLALTPLGRTDALNQLAAETVRVFDGFRAPPSHAELARRRSSRLSPRQERHLEIWGYPHVMEDFRFHITLTGPLPEAEVEPVKAVLVDHLEPLLPAPFRIDALSLLGAASDTGRFHLLQRARLTG